MTAALERRAGHRSWKHDSCAIEVVLAIPACRREPRHLKDVLAIAASNTTAAALESKGILCISASNMMTALEMYAGHRTARDMTLERHASPGTAAAICETETLFSRKAHN
mmetsp:Transcript_54662/g.97534  ORF Transcript_54662/g.97534 Transcript_54662/m.97534 type:complete len:110 (+) Transcript_54662:54-383(+)